MFMEIWRKLIPNYQRIWYDKAHCDRKYIKPVLNQTCKAQLTRLYYTCDVNVDVLQVVWLNATWWVCMAS